MKKFTFTFLSMALFTVGILRGQLENWDSQFVLIPEKVSISSSDSFRVDAYEIMVNAVTNLQYKAFTDATGYPCPLHWENKLIPKGKEMYPVIYVNLSDVTAYLRWLNSKSNRNYRLPNSQQFRVAAYSGDDERVYYWGDENALTDNSQVNYDHSFNRPFNQWEEYLKPARWGMINENGLYQMAGNIWHLIDDSTDPLDMDYIYRIESLEEIERRIMGGSWAFSKEHLKLGYKHVHSSGARYPDLGFRLVRDPEGYVMEKKSRNVTPVMHPTGAISLSWSILASDPADIRFNVYRLEGTSRPHSGFKVNQEPLTTSSFLDPNPVKDGSRYQYRIASVNPDGVEKGTSEWIGINAGQFEYPVIVQFKPVTEDGGLTPVFGDIEGWGRKGCVIQLGNGNKAKQQDPGKPVQLEAFSSTGRSLWRKDIATHNNIYGNAWNAPFNVWDMDGDGKADVITFFQVGEESYLAILDGMSGRVKHTTPWDKMATDVSKAASRVHMSIAYLDGKNPSVITMTGLYENEIISAYDQNLNKLWEYQSFMATGGSGSHKIQVADVDGDGKQEVIYGTTCLNYDGTMRWSVYKGHPDIVSIGNHIPDRPGIEVVFIVERMHPGIYMVDANTGEIIWKSNRQDDPQWSHGHAGWTSDIWAGSPGIESITNRKGHGDRNYLLFTADGQRHMEGFPGGFNPFEWDGDPTRELIGQGGKVMGKFNGKEIEIAEGVIPNPVPNSNLRFTADLYGDFRSELVIQTRDADGRHIIMVLAAPDPIDKMFISPAEDIEYMLWVARNNGGGYGTIYNFELKAPGSNTYGK